MISVNLSDVFEQLFQLILLPKQIYEFFAWDLPVGSVSIFEVSLQVSCIACIIDGLVFFVVADLNLGEEIFEIFRFLSF